MKPIGSLIRMCKHVARDACRRCRRAEAIQRGPGDFLAGAFFFRNAAAALHGYIAWS